VQPASRLQPANRRDYWVDDAITLPLPVLDGRPVIRGPRVQIPPRHTPDAGSQNWASRVLSALRDPVYRGSYALVANTIGTSVIGLGYWAAAARLYSPEELGDAAALVSALMLVATLSQLNLSSTLIRFLPQMGANSAGRLINISYVLSTATALAGSMIFVFVAPRLSSQWRFVGDSAFFVVIFAVSVVIWEIFTLQDAALVGLQRAGVVPIENVIYSLVKLALLVAAAKLLGSTDILFSWIIPLIFLIPAINWLIFRRCLTERSPHDIVSGLRLRHLARFASVDYVGSLCGQVTANVLPLLVISVLGPAAAGSFYIASLINSGAATLGTNFSTGLLVEAAATPDRMPEITRGALKRCVMVMGPATIVLFFGARLILRVYGGSYVNQTVVLFQLLSLSLLPICLEAIAFSLDRVAGKPIRSTLSQLAIAVLTLGGSWLLFGRLGLNAVGVAALGADTAIALVRLPTVLAVLRRRPGAIAQPARTAQQATVQPTAARQAPAQPTAARQTTAPGPRVPARRHYAGRHRAAGPNSAGSMAVGGSQPVRREVAQVRGPAPQSAQPAGRGPGGRTQLRADPRGAGSTQPGRRAGADRLGSIGAPGRPQPMRAAPRPAPGQPRPQDFRTAPRPAPGQPRPQDFRTAPRPAPGQPRPQDFRTAPRPAPGQPRPQDIRTAPRPAPAQLRPQDMRGRPGLAVG
jgi:O-antigen/teichoic acid export membrane protein